MTRTLEGIAPLPHLGIIRALGEDAARFLQGQLTQDFVLIPPGQARLAAFCNAKGRMQASFVGVQLAPDDFALVTSRDLLAQTLKRLSMFVLRAKVRLSDATEAFELRGLAGEPARLAGGAAPAPWVHEVDGVSHRVGLYRADGVPRALWLAPAGTPPPAGEALDPALWQWGEVRSGVATQLSAPVYEAFVPQMVNYESVGGVNFKKGCYPGQEVVARSQFRGTLKRRAFVAHAEAPLAAGGELFQASDPVQPCGLVVLGAQAPAGGWDAIVSVQLSAAQSGDIHVGAASGAALALQGQPYPLLEDI
ncbi:YgfZ/GcvT domain-containing protein [Ramlibacter rhizophilus]|uniref:Folate-binding protein n=1 Tax=Ramlibacter rhizophilus TaxID=1781167 RepID=A0A4Z0C3A7_9BURK|nr:folate-binding protein YgfZ [Ramlibacter rhizophilus]TFZ04968.1 folate-binding protein [Ramlibacter rhizophilus]